MARSGAQTMEQWIAAAQGDPTAIASRTMLSLLPTIARANLEVGNLSEKEQAINERFVNPGAMTLAEFAGTMEVLMRNWAERRESLVKMAPILDSAYARRVLAAPKAPAGYGAWGAETPGSEGTAGGGPGAGAADPDVDAAVNLLRGTVPQ
jgi:hypothetical protein